MEDNGGDEEEANYAIKEECDTVLFEYDPSRMLY